MLKVVAPLALLAGAAACAEWVADEPLDGVVVTRRALTISVPIDTFTLTAAGGALESPWGVRVMESLSHRSSWLDLSFTEPLNPATYRSPVRSASCRVLTDTHSCHDSATAMIASGRLVIAVRDSAMLALLFASRPTHLSFVSALPLDLRRVAVRYGAPKLRPPSKEALAEYDRAQEREHWGPWTRGLAIASHDESNPVWMQVGERTSARVEETQVRYNDEVNQRSDVSVSSWSSSDTSVVAIVPSEGPMRSVAIVALRPGKSTVAANGLRGPSDDLPRSARVRSLTRNIVVTNRITRVEITPRPATIVVGSRFELVARAIDETGAVVDGAPVGFYVIYDTPDKIGWEGKKAGHAADTDLTTPGRRRFIARFAKFADTLDVQVVPR